MWRSALSVATRAFIIVHVETSETCFETPLTVHIASAAITVELLNRKCLPTLLYGLLEACPLKSADLKSLDYIVVGAFMKIFKTKSKEVAILIAWRCSSVLCRPSLLTTENINFW